MLPGCEVLELLPKNAQGRVYARIAEWPTRVNVKQRTVAPPVPGCFGSVVGPAAKDEARRLLRVHRRIGKTMGKYPLPRPLTRSLRRVIQGLRPLAFCEWALAIRIMDETVFKRPRPGKMLARDGTFVPIPPPGPTFYVHMGTGTLRIAR